MKFEGVYTALVTPFNTDGSVDFGKLEQLVDAQLEAGVDGLLPVGTTGESPTVNVEEHEGVIETVIRKATGKAKVIAGTGANATDEAIELTRHALEAGADGTLQVTPYYNKPSQEGLYRHFSAVADLGLPVVLYNVPGRSGTAIAIDTIARLAEHPHVVAVKEAGGSVDRVSQIRQVCDLTVLSGDDSLALPMISVGASGVISVASNVIPAQVVELIHAALQGDFKKAGELHKKYYGFFCDMFIDTNPIPVKAAMALLGRIEEVYRLPLCPTSDANRAALKTRLQSLELL